VPEPDLTYQQLAQERITSTTSTINSFGQATLQLTDIVGERVVTVEARVTIGGREYTATQDVSFGKGPLSVFSMTNGTTGQWATANTNRTSNGFQASTTRFPAAEFCKGRVNRDVSVSTGVNSKFVPNDGNHDWSDPYWVTYSSSGFYERYARTSKLPTMTQLLAVSVYDSGHNASVQRRGAAGAAGWSFGSDNRVWTGEVDYFDSGSNHRFDAVTVYLNSGQVRGNGGGNGVSTTGIGIVCVP
jgi:hypothetical protein